MAELLSDLTAIDCFPVNPNDNADLAVLPRRLLIATGGTLKVTTLAGNTVQLTVPAGEFRCAVKRVFATGTAASGITGFV